MSVKLISLDVWNTLISSNPEYAKQRNQNVSEELDIPSDLIDSTLKMVKHDADKLVEQKGQCLTSQELYETFLFLVGRQDYYWLKLRNEIENIFIEYPPHGLREPITHLQEIRHCIGLSVASNTNFIRGKILCEATLDRWRIDWIFQVFSDQIEIPKPNSIFWDVVKHRASNIGVLPNEIIHIGDNRLCDGSCVQSGIRFQYNKSPATLLNTLENIHV